MQHPKFSKSTSVLSNSAVLDGHKNFIIIIAAYCVTFNAAIMLRKAESGTWLPAYVPVSSNAVVILLMTSSMAISTVCGSMALLYDHYGSYSCELDLWNLPINAQWA